MQDTFRYVFRFTEINTRLGERKRRSKTLRLSREFFDKYNVDGMIKEFRSVQDKFTLNDSTVVINSITVGRTQFQI